MAGGHEEERGKRKTGGDASAKGGEDDYECRRECWTSPQGRSTDPDEGRKRLQVVRPLWGEEERMGKALWQCNEEIQNMQDEPWRNEELSECEEALRLKDGDLKKASRLYKAKTGVGCDGFHPQILLDVTRETRGEIVEFLEKVEQSTTMFFLTANVDSLVRSPESARGCEMGAEVSRGTPRMVVMEELSAQCGKF